MSENKRSKARDEEYLGDGLYASFDGFALTLRAPREHGDHYVVLEDWMFVNLVNYMRRCRDERGVAP